MQGDAWTMDAANARRNERGLVAAGMALVIAGMQVFIIQPGFIAVLVSALNLTEAWAGYIASAEMFGIAIATIATAAVGRRLPWRVAVALSAIVLAGADLASIFAYTPLQFLAARAVAGLGAGVLISIGYSAVGMARNPDKFFGYVIMALLGYGAVGIFILPWTEATVGLGGILAALAVMAMLPLLLLRNLPASPSAIDAGAVDTAHGPGSSRVVVLALCAVAIFFLGQGVVWAYLGLIGTAAGVPDQSVATGLALSQVSGMLGAFGMAWLSGRVSQRVLLLGGTIASVAPLLALLGHVTATSYSLSVILFNGAANLMTPLLMAIAAAAGAGDPRVIQRAAALQMLGLATGPALAAPIAEHGGFAPVLVIAALLFAAVYPAARWDRGKSADARA